MDKNQTHYCRVCGLYQEFCPWGEDDRTPSFNICDCCGVEFGYEDATPIAIKKYREKWMSSGSKWWNEKVRPKNWNLIIQLKNLL